MNKVIYQNSTATFIDSMGSDLDVVDAARVSFDKQSRWYAEFTVKAPPADAPRERVAAWANYCNATDGKFLSYADWGLISYLANHGHWTPFAQVIAKFRLEVPLWLAAQLKRHQVGFALNEVSRRYVDAPPAFGETLSWRGRPTGGMKQGSSGELDPAVANSCDGIYHVTLVTALDSYEKLLELGVAPEQARAVLPTAAMTSWIWTGSLAAWARLCAQRLDPHAQRENTAVAHQVSDKLKELFPASWAALVPQAHKLP